MKTFIVILSLTLEFLFSTQSFSQEQFFFYHPMVAPLDIGSTFDLFNIGESKATKFFKDFSIKSDSAQKSNIYISVLSTKESFMNTFKFDSKLDAGFLGFSAEAKLSIDENQLYSKNSLTLCLIGNIDFGKQGIYDATVYDSVKRFAKENPVDFKSGYGEYFVSGIKRDQVIMLLLTITDINEKEKKQIFGDLKINAGTPIVFHSNLYASFNRLFERFNSTNRIVLRAITSGKNDYKEYPQLITNILTAYEDSKDKNFSVAATSALTTYMSKNFSFQNSNISGYFYSDLSQYGYLDKKYFYKGYRKFEKYTRIALAYKNVTTSQKLLDGIKESPIYDYLSFEDSVFLTNEMATIEAKKDNLSEEINNCKLDSCKKISECCNLIGGELSSAEKAHLVDLYAKYTDPFNDFQFYQTAELNFPLSAMPFDIEKINSDKFSKMNITYNSHTFKYELNFDITLICKSCPQISNVNTAVAIALKKIDDDNLDKGFLLNIYFNGEKLESVFSHAVRLNQPIAIRFLSNELPMNAKFGTDSLLLNNIRVEVVPLFQLDDRYSLILNPDSFFKFELVK